MILKTYLKPISLIIVLDFSNLWQVFLLFLIRNEIEIFNFILIIKELIIL